MFGQNQSIQCRLATLRNKRRNAPLWLPASVMQSFRFHILWRDFPHRRRCLLPWISVIRFECCWLVFTPMSLEYLWSLKYKWCMNENLVCFPCWKQTSPALTEITPAPRHRCVKLCLLLVAAQVLLSRRKRWSWTAQFAATQFCFCLLSWITLPSYFQGTCRWMVTDFVQGRGESTKKSNQAKKCCFLAVAQQHLWTVWFPSLVGTHWRTKPASSAHQGFQVNESAQVIKSLLNKSG